MWTQLLPALRMTLLLTVLTGLIYPGVVTGLCQVLFPAQANGSLISRNGKVVGSALIGQNFTKPEYLQPRPSAAGNDGYDAANSGGSNLGPTSQKLIDRIKATNTKLRADNPDFKGDLPADIATASASGLDPHVSPAAANLQINRIAAARGATPEQIGQIINQHREDRDLGFLGDPRVNVLAVNIALDAQFPNSKK
jgi:K+-transporting ATPase ATPase C chain